ncbi:MAG: helix-turn-helix domain-containing protein [Bilifractor sp.]|nr:helix-turn-helix domain-containing protein [Eubacterium sp.]MDY2836883.1 helix-turn-helix domain-containing protein [Bilifractor sp.]
MSSRIIAAPGDLPVQEINYLTVQIETKLDLKAHTFFCVMSGTVHAERQSFSCEYPAGSLFLIAPDESIRLSAEEPAVLLLLSVDSDFIYEHMNGRRVFLCDSVARPDCDYLPMKQMILQIAESCLNTLHSDPLQIMGNLYLLLSELRKMQPSGTSDAETPDKYQDRVRAIETYIDHHLAEPLTLTEIARDFYLTPQYFSSFMKSAFHQNFKSYLTERRLYYACRDLVNTDLSIMEIALRNGFGSLSVFRRNFSLRYHMSPLQYRKKLRSKSKPVAAVQDTVSLPPSFSGSAQSDRQKLLQGLMRQSVLAQADEDQGSFRHISSVINIGSAANLLSSRFRGQVIQLNSEMHFTHLRILELVSSSFIPMLLPDYSYYFQNVDTVMNFLFENHLAPWIELSRLPLERRPITSEDSSFYAVRRNRRFMNLLERFLQHIAGHWPEGWTGSWRFELWMSPTETIDEYMHDFREVERLLQTWLPGARLGGPGYNVCATPVSPEKILDAFARKNLKPDFFSIHLNDHVPAHTAKDPARQILPDLTIASDPSFPEQEAATLRHILKKYFPDTPLVVSEWSSAWIVGLPIADSRFQSSFIARTLLKLSTQTDLAAYWLLSDTAHAAATLNPPELYYFGQGLINREGLPTSAYFAYRLVQRLNGTILGHGDNYCITRCNPTHYQVLAFHYTHFTPSGEFPENNAFAFDRVYTFFAKEEALQISVTIQGLDPGIYLVNRILINEQHGSDLDIMIGEFEHSNLDRIDFLKKTKSPSPEELQYRMQTSSPEERRVFLKSDGSIQLETNLASHDVCFWDIRKQV